MEQINGFIEGGQMKNLKTIRKYGWKKLVIDRKIFYVFPRSRVPIVIERLTKFAGIELLNATKEERFPYLGRKR